MCRSIEHRQAARGAAAGDVPPVAAIRSAAAKPQEQRKSRHANMDARRPQFSFLRSFLMISRRALAYSSMIRRASSEREGLGFDASFLPGLVYQAGSWPDGSRRTKRGR
jgi:hypothetical protein